MTSIQPIPTWYAGCYFRSRLEARWAVFFQTLGIRWQYEAQGYDCQWRLSLADGTFPYLPDFWLPDLAMHAEVKGALTTPEADRLLNAAAYLSCPADGCGHECGGHDVAIFGEIPEPDLLEMREPPVLHMHKGTLYATPFFSEPNRCDPLRSVASDNGAPWMQWRSDAAYSRHGGREKHLINMLLRGVHSYDSQAPALVDRLRRGYTAARSARFEHGQSGAS
jgi:hypothetical protein